MNSKDRFPEGGIGRIINGGINTGGGMMYISSDELTHNPHLQTSLQYLLGLAFGLVNVEAYGYHPNPMLRTCPVTLHFCGAGSIRAARSQS